MCIHRTYIHIFLDKGKEKELENGPFFSLRWAFPIIFALSYDTLLPPSLMRSFRGKVGVITGTKEKRFRESFSSDPYLQLNVMLWGFFPQ